VAYIPSMRLRTRARRHSLTHQLVRDLASVHTSGHALAHFPGNARKWSRSLATHWKRTAYFTQIPHTRVDMTYVTTLELHAACLRRSQLVDIARQPARSFTLSLHQRVHSSAAVGQDPDVPEEHDLHGTAPERRRAFKRLSLRAKSYIAEPGCAPVSCVRSTAGPSTSTT